MDHIGTYIRLAGRSEQTLAQSFRTVADGHAAHADIFHSGHILAQMSQAHVDALAPITQRHPPDGSAAPEEPDRLHAAGLAQIRPGEIGLLRDLQDLHLLATLVQSTWTVLSQAAQGVRDRELFAVATACNTETARQLSWLNTRMKAAAPQALILAP